jgi:hypothetical protein
MPWNMEFRSTEHAGLLRSAMSAPAAETGVDDGNTAGGHNNRHCNQAPRNKALANERWPCRACQAPAAIRLSSAGEALGSLYQTWNLVAGKKEHSGGCGKLSPKANPAVTPNKVPHDLAPRLMETTSEHRTQSRQRHRVTFHDRHGPRHRTAAGIPCPPTRWNWLPPANTAECVRRWEVYSAPSDG